jgi:hypothetical protein
VIASGLATPPSRIRCWVLFRGNDQRDHAADGDSGKRNVLEVKLVEKPFSDFDEQVRVIVGLRNVRKAVPWIVERVDRERLRKEGHKLFEYIELGSKRMQLLGVKMLPAIKPIEGGHHAIYDTPNYRRLRRLITFAVRHKFVACGIVGIAFTLSGVGMGAVKQQFFPTSDRPEVLVEVRLPEGTSIETTTATVERLEYWLGGQPKAKIVTSYVGQGAPRFFFAMAPELPDRTRRRARLGSIGSERWCHRGLHLRPMCASLSSCSALTHHFRSSSGSWDLIPRNCTESPKRPSTSCEASRTCGRPTATGAIAHPSFASSRIRIG